MDALVAKHVVETGKAVVTLDTCKHSDLCKDRDRKTGYRTNSLVEVPLIAGNRTLGVLGAMNKKEGDFEQADVELLNMIAATVALSIENATVTEKLKQAYEEVASLNRAKDKAINHLSHELRTPVAILAASLNLVELKVQELAKSQWKATLERIHRSLDRMKDIQCEVDDIMHGREPRLHNMLSMIIHQCTDELEMLIAEVSGEVSVTGRIKDKIEEIFGLKEEVFEKISLHEFILDRLKALGPRFAHRDMDIQTQMEVGPPIRIPKAVLQKIFDGLLKNAIENTPDEGRIEVVVQNRPLGIEMVVKDYGIGISEENQRRIFEGFFPTQETMAYCSMRPFDFNAGGRGADLLRMKIFSERYQFNMDMDSSRCPCLKGTSDICPGRIGLCPACKEQENCHAMGGTTFRIFFPQTETASNLNHRSLVCEARPPILPISVL
jgi:signal transduction histidine kinase